LVINATPTAVVEPGSTFRTPAGSARTLLGSNGNEGGKVYRIEVTGYRAKAFNKISKFRQSNQVYMVSYDKLSQEYQRIHQQGGKIVSITAV
jgi:phycoerythrin-associated linker protein